MRKLTTDEYLVKVTAAHGSRYDCSELNYEGMSKPVTVLCKLHGKFRPTANNFSNGHGCLQCANMIIKAKLSKGLTGFVERCIAVHGDRYDYSKTEYRGALEHANIVCRLHGEFLQTAVTHSTGSHCPRCAIDARSRSCSTDISDVLKKFSAVHGDKYDYAKVAYKSAHDKIEVICYLHGPLFLTANAHKKGGGCADCSNDSRGESLKFTN